MSTTSQVPSNYDLMYRPYAAKTDVLAPSNFTYPKEFEMIPDVNKQPSDQPFDQHSFITPPAICPNAPLGLKNRVRQPTTPLPMTFSQHSITSCDKMAIDVVPLTSDTFPLGGISIKVKHLTPTATQVASDFFTFSIRDGLANPADHTFVASCPQSYIGSKYLLRIDYTPIPSRPSHKAVMLNNCPLPLLVATNFSFTNFIRFIYVVVSFLKVAPPANQETINRMMASARTLSGSEYACSACTKNDYFDCNCVLTTIFECTHVFHKCCLNTYLKSSCYCPVCGCTTTTAKYHHDVYKDKTYRVVVKRLQQWASNYNPLIKPEPVPVSPVTEFVDLAIAAIKALYPQPMHYVIDAAITPHLRHRLYSQSPSDVRVYPLLHALAHTMGTSMDVPAPLTTLLYNAASTDLCNTNLDLLSTVYSQCSQDLRPKLEAVFGPECRRLLAWVSHDKARIAIARVLGCFIPVSQVRQIMIKCFVIMAEQDASSSTVSVGTKHEHTPDSSSSSSHSVPHAPKKIKFEHT